MVYLLWDDLLVYLGKPQPGYLFSTPASTLIRFQSMEAMTFIFIILIYFILFSLVAEHCLD